jgi:hypothetical protein
MSERVKCPYCREEIDAEAVKCPHCESYLVAPQGLTALVTRPLRSIRRHPLRWTLGAGAVFIAVVLVWAAGEAELTRQACAGNAPRDIAVIADAEQVALVSCTAANYRDCAVTLNPRYQGGFTRTGVAVPADWPEYHALSDFATRDGQRFDRQRFQLQEVRLRCRDASNRPVEFAVTF